MKRDVAGAGAAAPYALGKVTSADGTTIGYRRLGQGPGILLLHGGMQAAQSFMRLGEALSEAFTVIIPDRRGRGSSGPFGEHYGIARECEDVRALLEETGARDVFALSSGAIIALQAGLAIPGIRKLAVYEPPLWIGSNPAYWVPRFDKEIAEGKLARAMVTVMKGTGDSRLLRLVPSFLLASVLRLGIRADAESLRAGDVPIRDLIPTMHYDAQIVTESRGLLEKLVSLRADVLLLEGEKSAAYLGRAVDALASVLPNATRALLPGVGHLAADDGGKPALVATALRRFFGPPSA